MRLTCPNCEAQYEVPDEVIPQDGRDVQCSNCGHTWFQPHPSQERAAEEKETAGALRAALQGQDAPEQKTDDTPEGADPETGPETGTETVPNNGERKSIDPGVANILREEAAHESGLRARERGGLESQPDLGLDNVPDSDTRQSPEAVDPMARMRGQELDALAQGSRSDLLPDIEEINSSLRGDAVGDAATGSDADESTSTARRSGSFSRGFGVSLVIVVAAFLIYSNAPKISQTVPQADPALNAYVTAIDQARLWLDTQIGSLLAPQEE